MFDEDKRNLHFLMESDFHDHCVLKVCCLTKHSEVDPEIYVLSAATDGCIAFWKINRDNINITLQRSSEHSSHVDTINHETSTKYRTSSSSNSNSTAKEYVIMTSNDVQGHMNDVSSSNSSDIICDKNDFKSGISADVLKTLPVEEGCCSKAEPLFILKHHQSGINGLDWCHCQGEKY